MALLIATATFSQESEGSEKCNSLKECVELTSKLSNKKYIFNKDLQGGFESTDEFNWTKENAETLLPVVLNKFGKARVKVDEDHYLVIDEREVRYNSFPLYKVTTNEVLDLPKTFDYYTLFVRLKNPEVAPSITRNLRPFLWRYGRIIENNLSGDMVLMSTGVNIHSLFNLIKEFDKKPSKEALVKFEKLLKEDRKEKNNNKEKTHGKIKNTHKKGD